MGFLDIIGALYSDASADAGAERVQKALKQSDALRHQHQSAVRAAPRRQAKHQSLREIAHISMQQQKRLRHGISRERSYMSARGKITENLKLYITEGVKKP